MDDFNRNDRQEIYSKKIRAGKRTYFFDVKSTRGNDYFLTITESTKKFEDGNYVKHKIFLYKEDFNKFIKGLNEAVDYVKTELMPDFDFDAFSHEDDGTGGEADSDYSSPAQSFNSAPETSEPASDTTSEEGGASSSEEVDKW